MESKEELVSVIIPVYNVENYLEECVDSVLSQIYTNLEVILVEDRSTDSSLSICEKKAQEDNRIKLIQHKKNIGLGGARNTGIKNAKGKYIYFLDSDDYIKSNLFSTIIPHMEENNLELCYFSADVFLDGEGLNWNLNTYRKNKTYDINDGKIVLKELNENKEYTSSNCMFLTKLSLIKENEINYRDDIYYEDNFFAFQLAVKSKKSAVINKSFYIRRVRPNSIMTSIDKLEKRVYSCKMVLNDFYSVKSNYNEETNKFINYMLRSFSKDLIDNTIKTKNKDIQKEIRKFLLNQKFYFDFKVFGYTIIKLYLHI